MSKPDKKDKPVTINRSGDVSISIAEINKKFGVDVGGSAIESTKLDNSFTTKYSTGILSLDRYLGVGGILGGRVMNAWGWEGSGKTLMAYNAIASIQLAGGSAAFLDAEGTFAPELAKAVGVDLDALILFRSTPERILCGEDYFDIMNMLIQQGIDLVVVDSVPALIPKSRLTAIVNQGQKATQAQMMSEGLAQTNAFLNASRKSIVWLINQVRAKPMVMFGPTEDHTGGSAVKFYATYSLELDKQDDIVKKVKTSDGKFEERRVGVTIRGQLRKNKTAPIPEKPPIFDIYFYSFEDEKGAKYTPGVDIYKDMVDTAIACSVVEQQSSWFKWDDFKTNGKDAMIEALRLAPREKLEKLREQVLAA